ncbi:helix-turn-helix transcriptional regulator [Streptomyces bottropensis]|uniref:helix-turn-helix transcriptional regulator n=1 Tax=Streptomyces bottropensis TaxID=42235 RepID=UPI0036C99B41
MVTVNIEGFLSTAEAAEHLGVKVESVYTFARRLDGFPQPTKVGRTLLWPEAEIDAWRAKHPARKRDRE